MDRVEEVLKTMGKGLLRRISCNVTNRVDFFSKETINKSTEHLEEESQEVAELVAKLESLMGTRQYTKQKMDLAVEIAAVKRARARKAMAAFRRVVNVTTAVTMMQKEV